LAAVSDSEIRSAIQSDIDRLQVVSEEPVFWSNIKLLMKKWKDNRNKEVQTFLDYFQMQWLDSNSGWFESYSPRVPSTNNSLEAINSLLE
jgi:hypothetical protein